MSPKASIPLDDILDAAWKLVKEEGAAKLSARALASRMGCSTMPIYSSVGSMEKLSELLRERVAEAIGEYQKRHWSDNPMLDAAVGYVRFARDEAALFKFLWLPSPGSERLSLEGLADRQRSDQAPPLPANPEVARLLSALSGTEMRGFEFHIWIFIHGIASLAAEGIVELDDKTLMAHLEAAGAAFYVYHSQHPRGGQG